jgi:hypothetical protein
MNTCVWPGSVALWRLRRAELADGHDPGLLCGNNRGSGHWGSFANHGHVAGVAMVDVSSGGSYMRGDRETAQRCRGSAM